MSVNYSPDEIFQIVNPDNSMTYNRFIAHAIGAVETIIYFSLISKMTYYYKNDRLDDEGFFYATVLDIQESTTFTKRQQAPAISKLVDVGLIQVKYAGLPKKKYFKILNDRALLLSLIEKGEEIADSIRQKKIAKKRDDIQRLQNGTSSSSEEYIAEKSDKSHNTQKLQNVTTGGDKMLPQEVTKCNDSTQQNVPSGSDKMSHKTKVKETKDNNLNLSINPSADATSQGEVKNQITMDMIDVISQRNSLVLERQDYEEIIRENIEYEYYLNYEEKGNAYSNRETLTEILNIMVDTVCSTAPTIRVNGSEVPQETVKSVFLKINSTHIDYVLYCLNNCSSEIRNIRSYLITSLYNSVSTVGTYWTSRVKADGVI